MRIYDWFYQKQKMRAIDSAYKIGLRVKDEDAFEKYLKKTTIKSLIWNTLFLAIIVYIIVQWVMRL